MNSWKISAFVFVIACFAFSQAANTVKLDTADGETIEVDIKVANVSGTISGLLEMFEVAETDEEFNIPLQNVNARILRLVLEWAEEHKHDPIVEGDLKNKDIPAWDAEFLGKMEKETVFEVILAANYLEVNGLLQVACKHVANMLKGKTPEQIRKEFNLKNDFSPEEQERMRAENSLQ